MSSHRLTDTLADTLARAVLGHVGREYPNKLDHVLDGPDAVLGPSALHPVFFGSFDWHSCVHGYWTLARLLGARPDIPSAPEIRRLFAEQLVPEKVAGECAYLDRPASRGFERPYGWAWLLKLAAELARLDDPAPGRALAPLTERFAGRFRAFLPTATYPVRVGTHYNTAFAIRIALDYAAAMRDDGLAGLLRDTATRWYRADRACPAWGEPSGDDFLSSCLMEAECMRVVLGDRFAPWLDDFLPEVARREPATLFRPATVSDRRDGKTAHLDGLNLSRAWCWRSLAAALPRDDERRAIMLASADEHVAASLPHVTGDYMGEHWLASFALLALDDVA